MVWYGAVDAFWLESGTSDQQVFSSYRDLVVRSNVEMYVELPSFSCSTDKIFTFLLAKPEKT